MFRLLPLALVGAVLPLQSLAQEVLVPNRRHDTSVFSVRVDDVRGANLTGGGVNYGKSRTMTVDLDVLTPVNNRGPILWDVGFGWKRMEFAYHVESGNPGALQAVKVPIGASWELGEVTTLVWHEHESPYETLRAGLEARGMSGARLALDPAMRLFVASGIMAAVPAARPAAEIFHAVRT